MITEKDKELIAGKDLTVEIIREQIRNFENGFPQVTLISAATPDNGIKILSDEEENRMISIFENSLSSGLISSKFVPSSGAASRMFKSLFALLTDSETKEDAEKMALEDPFLEQFFAEIKKFAFYDSLMAIVADPEDKREIVTKLLTETGLGYGQKPKGQLAFHKYSGTTRTPFEEHLVEAASYCTSSNGLARVHFTVSPEHQKGFEDLLSKIKTEYQKRFGIQFEVSFSFQHPWTDTIAVDENNQPFRDADGNLVFRPGGHGALIENLNNLDVDIIFIKNIDNVVPDHLKADTKKYKKVLAGFLVSLRNQIFTYLEKLDKLGFSEDLTLFKTIDNFLQKELCVQYALPFNSSEERINFYKQKLNRPLRVCGMVKNEGEPGGGPFVVYNADGTASLQIIEMAQIDFSDEKQSQIVQQSTHFNPVDIICSIKDYKGRKYDLLKYRDPETGFISFKSQNGKPLKALELPGLWNGAMANWNTVFVEVPAITFNPVKTINDLLRPEHQ
jgi:hypothetical protein